MLSQPILKPKVLMCIPLMLFLVGAHLLGLKGHSWADAHRGGLRGCTKLDEAGLRAAVG